MFRASQRPSSGVPKIVSATSGIGHGIGTATSFHRGLIRTIPEVADTGFGTPEDGRCDARNM
jgi:SLT domain-containing protein